MSHFHKTLKTKEKIMDVKGQVKEIRKRAAVTKRGHTTLYQG